MNKKTIIIVAVIIIIAIVALLFFLRKPKSGLEISLYDNGSTGYYWEYKIDNTDIIEVADKVSDYSNCPKDTVGCGGKMIFRIKPLKEGNATIIFTLTSFRGDTSGTVTYNIKVSKDLKISETHTATKDNLIL